MSRFIKGAANHTSSTIAEITNPHSGDDGTTSTFHGHRAAKAELLFVVLGDVDELNAAIGCVVAVSSSLPTTATTTMTTATWMLPEIQRVLFSIGTCLEYRDEMVTSYPFGHLDVIVAMLRQMEEKLFRLESELPPLAEFVIPGDTLPTAFLHVARTVCRRAERSAVGLFSEQPLHPAKTVILPFLNRLGHYLFVLSRFNTGK